MNNLKVSILIPAYNSEQFIEATIRSCLAQTYDNIEIIIVDDGSTDRTLSISKELEIHHPQIKVFSQNNLGACKARNIAFEKSTGDYIMYLDADDLISPDKIQSQIDLCLGPKEVSMCPWIEFKDDMHNSAKIHRFFYHDYNAPIELLIDLWSSGEMVQPACYLVPRSLISSSGGWDESLLRNQDGEFFCRLLMKASKIKFAEKPIVYYRRGHASISTSAPNKGKKLESTYQSFVSYEKATNDYLDNKRLKKALSRNYSIIMAHSAFDSNLYRSAQQRILSLGCNPKNPKPSLIAKIVESVIGYHNYLKLKSIINGSNA